MVDDFCCSCCCWWIVVVMVVFVVELMAHMFQPLFTCNGSWVNVSASKTHSQLQYPLVHSAINHQMRIQIGWCRSKIHCLCAFFWCFLYLIGEPNPDLHTFTGWRQDGNMCLYILILYFLIQGNLTIMLGDWVSSETVYLESDGVPTIDVYSGLWRPDSTLLLAYQLELILDDTPVWIQM